MTVGVPNQFIKDWLSKNITRIYLEYFVLFCESVRSLSFFSVVRFDTPPKKNSK